MRFKMPKCFGGTKNISTKYWRSTIKNPTLKISSRNRKKSPKFLKNPDKLQRASRKSS